MASLPEGVTARVQLAPFRVTQAGIRTAEVGYAPLAQALTTVGYVAFDERLLANVASKVPGKTRVETLFVNFQGKEVKAGEPLAELYSPELSQAIAELRTARRAEQESAGLQTAAARSLLGDRRNMVRLSSEKLKRWGITQAQIDDILRQDKDDYKIPILSPIGGTVVRKNVVEGQEVQEGFAMFEVADLSHVWVQAQVYEHQIGLVREGQAVEASVEAFPGRPFPGKVAFIQPTLDPTTRTVEVRFDLEKPRPPFAARHVRHGDIEDPGGGDLGFSGTHGRDAPHARRTPPASLSVEEQKNCPVTTLKLGSMGDPIPVEVEGRKVWTCCGACPPKLKAQPAKFLARLEPAPP